MAIKKIKVSNFKTFKDLDLELGSLNVVIGANASGKSNLTQIFKFLRDVEDNDLKNAISMNGGLDYLCNLNAKASEELKIGIILDNKYKYQFLGGKESKFETYKHEYEFSLKRQKTKFGFSVVSDKFTLKLKCAHVQQEKLFEEEKSPLEGILTISKDKKEILYEVKPTEFEEDIYKDIGHLLSRFFGEPGRKHPFSRTNNLLIQEPVMRWIFPSRRKGFFPNTAIYDFDPHKAKNPVKITGKAELEEDGSNLAIVLNNIIESEDDRRKLCNLVKDLLPFVKEVGTEKFAEKSLMITLQEDYYADKDLRADLLSDGTVNITALIVALYFEEKEVVIIEEPERNIHPHLISRMIEMMKEASKKKQIIVTTHSPEVVKHAGLDNLLLISRDSDGFSHISRPKERKEIQVFLENELGLDELYVQDLLGAE
jgi:predicted ATPase